MRVYLIINDGEDTTFLPYKDKYRVIKDAELAATEYNALFTTSGFFGGNITKEELENTKIGVMHAVQSGFRRAIMPIEIFDVTE